MINSININNYKLILGKNKEQHNEYARRLNAIIKEKLKNASCNLLDLYNMNGDKSNINAGVPNSKIVIFTNRTMHGCTNNITLENLDTINGIVNDYKSFLQPLGATLQIKSDNGTVIAEWFEELWELNILFNIFEEYNETSIKIFEYIISELDRLYFLPKTLENSWKHTPNKGQLTKTFTDVIKKNRQENYNNNKRQIESWESDLNEYRRRIKSISDNLITKRRQLACDEEGIQALSDMLINDLDLIIANEKIKDLQIKNGKFFIFTNPLYIYSDKGKRYYGGEYTIELNPNNSDVKFFGNNPRRGYWTDQDPHPHVNGTDGHACLGNVSSTIAELCAQMQIYALVMVLIDFLESANTQDIAGKKVVNWDEVDDKGNIIEKAKPTLYRCPNCDGEFEELFSTFALIYEGDYDDAIDNDDYELVNERMMCEDCRSDYAYWDDNVSAYIRE